MKRHSKVTGVIKHYENFKSEFISSRHVDVWLPEGYAQDSVKHVAVIYMHDGQNLFDPATSFIGVDWGIDETMTTLIRQNQVNETIVVGIWNTEDRRREYMPEKAFNMEISAENKQSFIEKYGGTPLSDAYLKFIVKELKPFIDKNYRTFPEQPHTFIMGSSMGGLISLYALCEYPDIFGGAGCLSTHWPIMEGIVIRYLETQLPAPGSHKIYFDFGTETLDADYEPYQDQVDEIIQNAGYTAGKNWITKKFPGDEHSERAWRKRVHIPIEFFLKRDNKLK